MLGKTNIKSSFSATPNTFCKPLFSDTVQGATQAPTQTVLSLNSITSTKQVSNTG